ncbi:unnamed protein product [Calicophoron daubneyi]|uniref:FIT family protein n=1 Tax=Calicophoron daubneyi TaxID=300641 RepID=A0AAV2T0B1_CALDB
MKQAAIKKFSNIRLQPLPPDNTTGGRKKSVPGPTSLMHVMSLLLFHIFRRPMFVDTATKAGIYLCAAAGLALIFDFIRVPPSYFSNKYNLLNIIFVKWGWGWTFVFLSAFQIFSSFVYTASSVSLMRSHLLRIAAGTGCWYSVTGFINLVHEWSGHCQPHNIVMTNRHRPQYRLACQRAGGIWIGFDISGHCFLLVLCSLWIMEEVRCMQCWSRLSDIIKPYERDEDTRADSMTSHIRGLSTNQLKTMRSSFRRLTGSVRVLFSICGCLSMIWDFMFLCTIMYFHTMPSKLIGTILGVACWFLCYRVIFPLAKTGEWYGLAPGMPGDGVVNFTSRR